MKSNDKKRIGSAAHNGIDDIASRLGVLEWFHKNDFEHIALVIRDLKSLKITNLRTGISWADFHSEDGQKWYDWLIPTLAANFDLLPCITYTPPSISMDSVTSPPKDPKSFADFIDQVITLYGNHFEYIELWNEPNNITSYNYKLDPGWDNFAQMIILASGWAKQRGKKTVLGGMSPVDPNWLGLMARLGALNNIDVVGIHGFPSIFDSVWSGWQSEIGSIQQVLDSYQLPAEIWITETGYSTRKNDESVQILKFIDAFNAPVKKVFWYSLVDLAPSRSTPDGFHLDEREYHFGMKQANGMPKLLFRMLEKKSPAKITKEDLYIHTVKNKPKQDKGVLITGGAGFIGTNVADKLLSQGERVIIYDNLSRPGVENNLAWLVAEHPQVEVIIADVRDKYAVEAAVNESKHIFHFAAQVAVTSSLILPDHDFEVNIGGTLNILEAIRLSAHKPSLIFTSTNKVYGDLPGLELESNNTRYYPVNPVYHKHGISENLSLNFHSPYGCSKGSADQYILDYARSFGLRTVVFRMSCIYGPHQFGTEDQGWVAHFIRQAINNKVITLYGDGKQVRDILYVDDLINAFLLARQNIGELAGEAFNMGGGAENAVSLVELLTYLNSLDHLNIQVEYDAWRVGDQKYYVSDTRKFRKRTGWRPHVSYREGLINIYSWLNEYQESFIHEKPIVQ